MGQSGYSNRLPYLYLRSPPEKLIFALSLNTFEGYDRELLPWEV